MLPQRIAYLDLDTTNVKIKEIPEEITKKFLGGRGINIHLLYNHVTPEIDPLSPQNPLIIGPGILTGLKGIGASRCNISGKSPETGLLGDANIGGHFGAFMKRTGIDCLFITGASKKPIYIHLDNGGIRIEDAKDLWGKSTKETNTILKRRYGPSSQSISIGIAGENLVRFACIINRKKNAAGRTGLGCLMGAKKIKAIVVSGEKSIKPKDENGFHDLVKSLQEKLKKEPLVNVLSQFGSVHLFNLINQQIGMGRAYNGLSTTFPENKDISPEILKEKYYTGKAGCFSCPVACQHRYKTAEVKGEGPEYTILASFGPVVGIKSVETVLYINDLINSYGLDASSTANLIAWTVELFKKGLIDENVTNGLKLDWGDEKTIIELIHQIAHRDGFGNLLAEGAKAAVNKLGEETAKYLIWTKYLPQSDPVDLRYLPAYALGNAVASRGSDHLRSRPTWEAYGLSEDQLKAIYGGFVSANPRSCEGKGRVIWWWETYLSLFDALGLCKLIAFHCRPGLLDFQFFSELIQHSTGLNLTPEEIFEVGERIVTLERMFIVREGIRRKDDSPPQRYFESLNDLRLDREKFEQMLDEYYQFRGFDKEGRPLEETIKRLGLK
ncbi:aldehyde:ferredoxin oxidoreductase [Candidatus Desulfofervidus auxilii]|uniref:Aldehyde:ferredoxin oxidoreductase n=1 Tax=Desulfofervidus auxilii TaxID=1621989 RepID=A0A7U4THR8_DESA2|nr:aldehyde ferredoxin oxidoreductase family protein [Candidatus Desulfofervidus auxilii]AMM41154.1 aldehyde:ferredoxin oxidoreductase [Candidatus Desulfofervidus auxilii]